MGYQPRWYALIVAAKSLGVPPWDLLDKPVFWREVALAAMSAENRAREQLEKHQR